jgi:flavorubredoxin
MIRGTPITDDILWVGVNDRKTQLFEALWPLPHGVSYNSYLIMDEKVVLVDAVKDVFAADLLGKLHAILGPNRGVDYLIINHMEPDHSGSVKILPQIYPEMKIIGNKKTLEFLQHLHGVTENVVAVDDAEILDIGRRKLQFFHVPMVHWPETMMTYETSDQILFSADAFGGFGTLERGIFDDVARDRAYFEEETLRYFSNIVGKFSPMVQKALAKIKDLPIRVVAPSHGIIWREEPHRIIRDYDRWSRHEAEPGITVAWGSMYGNTERAMEAVVRGIAGEGMEDLRVHDVSQAHLSYLVRDIWRGRGVVLGTPTYDVGVFPPMKHLVDLLEHKRLTNRLLGIFGSYGWSGGGVKGVSGFAERMQWEVVQPVVEARFAPEPEELEQCETLGRNLARRVLEA